jgi:hypothetical protein
MVLGGSHFLTRTKSSSHWCDFEWSSLGRGGCYTASVVFLGSKKNDKKKKNYKQAWADVHACICFETVYQGYGCVIFVV